MKFTQIIVPALGLSALLTAASATTVTNQVELLLNPVSKPNNTFLGSGEFTLRLGYFTYDTGNFALNNAAIVANQFNQASLNSNFQTLFSFNAAEQLEGDTGATGEVEGAVGIDAGGPGLMYAYLTLPNATYSGSFASFIGENMYAWIQLDSNPTQQAIFGSSSALFGAPDTVNNLPVSSVLQIQEDILSSQMLVGNNRTALASNDYQLVPEPSTAFLLISGLGAFALRRRRNA